jgi:putative oxidoreductase
VSTYEDDGLFLPSKSADTASSTYNSSGGDPSSSFEPDGDYGFTSTGDTTSIVSPGGDFGDPSFGDEPRRPAPKLHGGADFGLLVLRLVLGGTFIAHGLQHLFGTFHGVGIHGFEAFVRTSGYVDPTVLAYVAGGTELAGGGLIVLGLFTPLAAAALLGLLANVIVLKWPLGFFEPGYELELALSGAAFAILFAGPGRVSLDRPTPWFRRPVLNGWIFLIIGAAVAIVFLFVLRNH